MVTDPDPYSVFMPAISICQNYKEPYNSARTIRNHIILLEP